jgi:hypothetical protein
MFYMDLTDYAFSRNVVHLAAMIMGFIIAEPGYFRAGMIISWGRFNSTKWTDEF